MEFLAFGRWPTRQKRVRDLQRLRDLLGLHHDLAVLRTAASQAEAVARDATFFRAIDKRQAIIAERAERLGGDVLRAKPKRLAEALLRRGVAVAAASRR
jgi:hypothetical protein